MAYIYDINGNPLVAGTDTNAVVGEKLIDISDITNTGYSGTLHEQYGSNYNLLGGFVNMSVNKTLYYKSPVNAKFEGRKLLFGCYDSDKNFLYLDTAPENVTHDMITSNFDINGIGYLDDGVSVMYSVGYYCITVPDEVSFIRVANKDVLVSQSLFAIGYTPFTDLMQTWNDYITTAGTDFSRDVYRVNKKPAPVGVFIGDSLTNWGGGNDATDGFLKIVHEKTGLITKNEGLAGAWWQTGDEQTQCAVTRVDSIISSGRRYSLYCFLMGTNAGSDVDSGETSADTTTMCGAIRYCMEKLKAYDPNSRILVCLPPQRAVGNAKQEKVNEVIKAIAESYSVKTLDLYHHSGVVPNTIVAGSDYLSDGLHLNTNGMQAIGDTLAAEIKYLLCL